MDTSSVRAGGGLNVTGSPYEPANEFMAWTTGTEVVGSGADSGKYVVISIVGWAGASYGVTSHSS